jgi:hypothetical protein
MFIVIERLLLDKRHILSDEGGYTIFYNTKQEAFLAAKELMKETVKEIDIEYVATRKRYCVVKQELFDHSESEESSSLVSFEAIFTEDDPMIFFSADVYPIASLKRKADALKWAEKVDYIISSSHGVIAVQKDGRERKVPAYIRLTQDKEEAVLSGLRKVGDSRFTAFEAFLAKSEDQQESENDQEEETC